MALGTYSELQAGIKGWLMDRADIVAMIPNFIVLAETDFNDRVRHRLMHRRSTTTATDYRVALPQDWLEAVNIQVTADNAHPSQVFYASPENLDEIRDRGNSGGIPTHFGIVGSELEFVPAPDGALIEMTYYGRIPALSDLNPTNWLLTARPDAYLYGALTHAAPYLMDDARVATWVGARDAAITNLNDADRKARTSGGPLRRRLRTFG
jgi:hypothetical protein